MSKLLKNSKPNIITRYTLELLRKELEGAERDLQESMLDIGATGGSSDWHDNAPLDFAHQRTDLNTSRVSSLRQKLANYTLIESNGQTSKVGIGNAVIVKYNGETEEETFTILGPDDSRRKDGWVSHESPLGKALMGRKAGDAVAFEVKQGGSEIKLSLKIVKILKGDFD